MTANDPEQTRAQSEPGRATTSNVARASCSDVPSQTITHQTEKQEVDRTKRVANSDRWLTAAHLMLLDRALKLFELFCKIRVPILN